MSNRFDLRRARLAGIALAVTLVFAAVPVAAQAAPSTSAPPPRSSSSAAPPSPTPDRRSSTATSASRRAPRLDGFGLPAVVNGATHANDDVAAQAQADLTTAYNVAAGQPVSPAQRTHRHRPRRLETRSAAPTASRSSAQLTGQLTLDAAGRSQRPVRLRDRLHADHRIGQLGHPRQRRLALQRLLEGRQLGDVRLHHRVPGQPDGADHRSRSTTGSRRSAASSPATAQVTLINDVLTSARNCATGSTTPPSDSERRRGPGAPTPDRDASPTANHRLPGKGGRRPEGRRQGHSPVARRRLPAVGNGTATHRCRGRTTTERHSAPRSTASEIKSVVFTDNGKRIGEHVEARTANRAGHARRPRQVVAHVTFKDATKRKTETVTIRRVPCPCSTRATGPRTFTG